MHLLTEDLSGELRYNRSHLNDQVKGAPMKPYKQLASEQRYQIYGLKQAGLDQSLIALNLVESTNQRFQGS